MHHPIELPVVVLKIVILLGRQSLRHQSGGVAMGAAVDRSVAVAGGIDGAVRRRESQISRRRHQCRPRGDDAVHRHARRSEGPQVAGGGEARVIVASLGHGCGHDGDPGVSADLEPVELAVGDGTVGERKHRPARRAIEGDTGGIHRRGRRHVGTGGGIDLEQPVRRNRLGRRDVERVIAIERDSDRVAVLRQRGTHAGDRLRHDRPYERAKVEPEIEASRRRGIIGGGSQPGADRDAIGVVGQRFGESYDDFVLVGQVVDGDAAGHDRLVGLRAGVAEAVSGGTASHDRNAAERAGGDLDARAEPQRDLLRRLG